MSDGIKELSAMGSMDPIMGTTKKPKRSYTREFLLSLSELEVCKKLPNGFDESLLSEFEEASYGIQDRQSVRGSSSSQGFRRMEYGSSVPARGDSGGDSRGPHRWDSRPTGRSDTDSDSESGRRYGSLTRRSRQHPEHDGLLGSGSFPRPPGCAAGASATRFRPNSNIHLSKSNEPYQPPRPFKAVPRSRRETKDSYNDETFGSADSTSEDKVEEEKRRRAEFELMRKQQQKVLQEKQKPDSSKLEDSLSDFTRALEGNDGKISGNSVKVLKQDEEDDSGKSVSLQNPPSRPLVPPGFVNNAADKTSTVKTLMHDDPLAVGKKEMQNNHQDIKNRAQQKDPCELQCGAVSPSASKFGNMPSVLDVVDQVKSSSLSDMSEILDNGEAIWLDPELTGPKLKSSGCSTSILEKLFSNALTAGSDSTSNLVEKKYAKEEDNWGPNTLQSKFASWFLEEDKKSPECTSQEKPNDLLSLIGGGERGGSGASDVTAIGPASPLEMMLGQMTSKSPTENSTTASIPEPFSSINTTEQKPAVLTCEDLEQTILSEIGGNGSHSQITEQKNIIIEEKAKSPDIAVDNLASQHLLSLLQRGMESNHVESTSPVKKGSPQKPVHHHVCKTDATDGNINGIPEELNSSGKTLTLEALFGTAFMNELHSQQNSVGSARSDVKEPSGLPYLSSGDALFSSTLNEIGNVIDSGEGSIFMSNNGMTKLNNVGNLGFHDLGKELEFSKPPAEVDSLFGGLDREIELRLHEEDNLVRHRNHMNAQNSILRHDSSLSRADLLHSSNASVAALEDEISIIRGQDPLLFHGPPREMVVKPELPYQSPPEQATSPHLHAPQIMRGKSLLDLLNPHNIHLDSPMNFTPPDAPFRHQLPVNMGHPSLPHLSGGLQGLGIPPPHLIGRFPGGPPMPPRSSHNHNLAGYIQEHHPMQGFPFGGPRVPPPGPDFGVSYNHSEAYQRMVEMEPRGNPKQVHPFAGGGGHGRPMYGPELDMGFRYR